MFKLSDQFNLSILGKETISSDVSYEVKYLPSNEEPTKVEDETIDALTEAEKDSDDVENESDEDKNDEKGTVKFFQCYRAVCIIPCPS